MTGVTVTTSIKAVAQLVLLGSSNAVSGLTLSGSGTSLVIYNMPAVGYADTGRIVTLMLNRSRCFWFPASALPCVQLNQP